MKINVKRAQNIYDIALENYGTCETLKQLLLLNPQLRNDPQALSALYGPGHDPGDNFYIDAAVAPEDEMTVDRDSTAVIPSVLNEIETEITTYTYTKEFNEDGK